MAFKTAYIDMGYGPKWSTETAVKSLIEETELSVSDWWRRMAILMNVAFHTSDSELMAALETAKKVKWGSGFPEVEVTTPQNYAASSQPSHDTLMVDNQTVIENCFKFPSDFVKQKVLDIVNEFYLGVAANLTLIEIALFDHNLLKKRNQHTSLLKSLIAWGVTAIKVEDVPKIANSMANKMKSMPADGYKDWVGNDLVNDKKLCTDIGTGLGTTIPYSRKKSG